MWVKNKQSGFTIVELLIVVVVIGVLAAITILSLNGVQQRARDSERQNDVTIMHKQLEIYYISKGYYPVTESMLGGQGFPFAAANFLDSNTGYMIAPGNTDTANSSYRDFSGPAHNVYGYIAYKSNGTKCTTTTGDTASLCTRYSLFYRTEKPVAVKSINSLNN